MILTRETIQAYNSSRTYYADKSIVCHAPYVNLNFEQSGQVKACCYNVNHVLGKWPEQSIREIWDGEKLKALRDYISENNMGGGCIECGKMIEAGNYQGVKARYYDIASLTGKITSIARKIKGKFAYPSVMEFELSNECNLECIMCNGNFSSSIRKNREKLPPIVSPYNDKFVDELEEFIPHLTDAKFLGGEPFMVDIYLRIWERISKINPNIRIHITTNGTFLNNRIKNLLEGLNAGIIISIDSIERETYKKIRVNGNYDKVMENLDYFIDYAKRKKTFVSMAACPMVNNWRELPQMLEFCLSKNIALFFNTVFAPLELSLSTIDMEEVILFLENYNLPNITGHPQKNPKNVSISAYRDFILLLKGWQHEKTAEVPEVIEILETHDIEWSPKAIADMSYKLIELQHRDSTGKQQKETQKYLAVLFEKTPHGRAADSLYCFIQAVDNYLNKTPNSNSFGKLKRIGVLIEEHPKRDHILSVSSQANPLEFADQIAEKDIEELEKIFRTHFSLEQ